LNSLSLLAFGLVDLFGLSSHVESEEDDVAITNFVLLALLVVKTLILDSVLRTKAVQIFESHDFSTNKAALEIGMDHTSSAGCLCAFTDGPALDLVLTSGEVVEETQVVVGA